MNASQGAADSASPTSRAAVGALFGAGAAMTTTMAMEGPNLEFKTGTQFTVLTNAPSRLKSKAAQ